ncbi:hypothetical protein OAQ30_01905 [Nitrosopumilus sp.]|nr:hypothetical protein [Nitrosopumilus sp.]MDC0927759.1 hypothetical protein [Nitrosopumilus sp.]
MSNISSKALSSFKYVYLIIFFTLLSGFFYPLITQTSFEPVVYGILILFVGLAGGILLYKSATSETKKYVFFISGFALLGISLYYICEITNAF